MCTLLPKTWDLEWSSFDLEPLSPIFALQNNSASAGMTRRNTYVCSDRNNADRLSVIPNGKENRWELELNKPWSRILAGTAKFQFELLIRNVQFVPWLFFVCLFFFFCSSFYFHLVSCFFFVVFGVFFSPACLWCGVCIFFPFLVSACPAWLRWLVPLAPLLLLPLVPSFSAPRPLRYSRGIIPSALCTLVRQTGPPCPTPTTLWTAARPSKTAGLPVHTPTLPRLSPVMYRPRFALLTHTCSSML